MDKKDIMREIDRVEAKMPDPKDSLNEHELYKQELFFLLTVVKSDVGITDNLKITLGRMLDPDYNHPKIGRIVGEESSEALRDFNTFKNRNAGLTEIFFPRLRQHVELALRGRSLLNPQPESHAIKSAKKQGRPRGVQCIQGNICMMDKTPIIPANASKRRELACAVFTLTKGMPTDDMRVEDSALFEHLQETAWEQATLNQRTAFKKFLGNNINKINAYFEEKLLRPWLKKEGRVVIREY